MATTTKPKATIHDFVCPQHGPFVRAQVGIPGVQTGSVCPRCAKQCSCTCCTGAPATIPQPELEKLLTTILETEYEDLERVEEDMKILATAVLLLLRTPIAPVHITSWDTATPSHPAKWHVFNKQHICCFCNQPVHLVLSLVEACPAR